MTVWIVQVSGFINSVWADKDSAKRHMERLIEVNGDQIAVRVHDFEVRTTGRTR